MFNMLLGVGQMVCAIIVIVFIFGGGLIGMPIGVSFAIGVCSGTTLATGFINFYESLKY